MYVRENASTQNMFVKVLPRILVEAHDWEQVFHADRKT